MPHHLVQNGSTISRESNKSLAFSSFCGALEGIIGHKINRNLYRENAAIHLRYPLIKSSGLVIGGKPRPEIGNFSQHMHIANLLKFVVTPRTLSRPPWFESGLPTFSSLLLPRS